MDTGTSYLWIVLVVVGLLDKLNQVNSSSIEMACSPISLNGLECYDAKGLMINCTQRVPLNGWAKCKNLYIPSVLENKVECGIDGWTDDNFSCQIVCGKAKEGTGYRPFSATIYQIVKKELNLRMCSGTLIGGENGFVLTTAHCVLDHQDKQLDIEVLLVGLGPPKNETLFKVRNINYSLLWNENGLIDPDELVILSLADFSISEDILPACLPTCGQIDSTAVRDGSTGEIFAYGKDKPEKLKVRINENCTYLNDFCAGNSSDPDRKKCQEEIGTGITVAMGEVAHFIYGILSPTSNPGCKNFRTFKRVFPYNDWIRSILSLSDHIQLPTTTTIHEFSSTESVEWDPKVIYFNEILEENQPSLTNLSIANCTVKPETLLNSIRLAKNLTKLELRNVTLLSGFDGVEELPNIMEYILIGTVSKKPKGFSNYFPFHKGQNVTYLDFPRLYKQINIDDDEKKFVMKPNEGILLLIKFEQLADKILTGAPSGTWKKLTLHDVAFNITSIPSTLKYLHLSDVNLSEDELTSTLLKCRDLEDLIIHNVGDRQMNLEDLPTSLQSLRLDRVNLTMRNQANEVSTTTEKSLFSFFNSKTTFTNTTSTTVMLSNLTSLYLGVDVTLDVQITQNFGKIFPNVKQVAYFGVDDSVIIESVLKLKDLKFIFVRIQNTKSDEAKKIFNKLEFDPTTLANSSVNIQWFCAERKNKTDKFILRMLKSKEDFITLDGRFDKC